MKKGIKNSMRSNGNMGELMETEIDAKISFLRKNWVIVILSSNSAF
jgi:hypothetical protein